MKYRIFLLFLVITSCAQNLNYNKTQPPYNSKGFAYIYNDSDHLDKIISNKLDHKTLQIAHSTISQGSLIKLINPKTKESIILKNEKKIRYPEFYKILITNPVADRLKLNKDFPFIEVLEIKKNKSFIAKKAEIFSEEKKIYNNAPVELIKIDNISKNKSIMKNYKDKIYIVVAEFYSKNSANSLRERITKELGVFNSNKLIIKTKKTNKITLLSGPYNSINSMKNDYILLKNFGFEELDVSINE